MAEEKLFTKEAVITAIRTTARGMAGLLKKEEACALIESLPESLAEIVMEESIKASKEQAIQKAKHMAKALSMLADHLGDSKED